MGGELGMVDYNEFLLGFQGFRFSSPSILSTFAFSRPAVDPPL